MLHLNTKYCVPDQTKLLENSKKDWREKLNPAFPMSDWLDIDRTVTQEEINRIKALKEEMETNHADTLIVIGIGGSYLGAKAILDALNPYFQKPAIEVIFAGTSLSSEYLTSVQNLMNERNVYVNVISKSGNTLEPSIAFEIIEAKMKERYPDYQKRIVVTTDREKGSLLKHAQEEGYRLFEVPRNIGGRFSCLTVVGLLPVAIGGVDIDLLLKGARNGIHYLEDAFTYASLRYQQEQAHFPVELITFYEEKLESFGKWVGQLLGETQGKNKKGILPVPNFFTANLHSLGQYLQEGADIAFETVIKIENSENLWVPSKEKDLHEINNLVVDQVAKAHQEGNTQTILIELDRLDAYTLGELIYFYFLAAAIGGYLLEINPFDQPGVERYKELVQQALQKEE